MWALVVIGLLLIVPACVTSDSESLSVNATPTTGVEEGSLAPDLSLQDVRGGDVTLSDLRGQVVMLNFWAVWCGFCRIEMPEIQAAHEAYQNQGFTVLGIDVQEEAEVVRRFGEEMGLTFPLLLDVDARVTRTYEIRGLPTSLFIDQKGVIFAVHVGPLDKAAIARYLAQVGVQ